MSRRTSPSRATTRTSSAGEDLLRTIGRDPLVARVRSRLLERCGCSYGRAADDDTASTIVVGVSGGPDSTALAALLAAASARRSGGPRPVLVAVHHGLRSEADEECAAVARLARRLGAAYERIDVRPAERPGNLSANARDDRYRVLLDAARRHGARWVAVAHHAEDRLESLLLGVARGRGLRGMTQPAWRRRLGASIDLVRPLLDTSKEECLTFCERHGLSYAVDPSNLDPRRARGHLRRAVLPGLVERWPGIVRHATRLADEAAAARLALGRLVRRRFGPPTARQWERERCRSEDAVVVEWAFRAALGHACPDWAHRVTQRTWERLVRAARDDSSEPRWFAMTGGARRASRVGAVAFEVRARAVRLVVGGPST